MGGAPVVRRWCIGGGSVEHRWYIAAASVVRRLVFELAINAFPIGQHLSPSGDQRVVH